MLHGDGDIAQNRQSLPIAVLPPESHQLMTSAGVLYLMVFDGEVYDHTWRRPELGKVSFAFQRHSDTEVMLSRRWRPLQLAWRWPVGWNVRDDQDKWLLRQVHYWHVSKMLIDRPKRRFGWTIVAWLRWPFRGRGEP